MSNRDEFAVVRCSRCTQSWVVDQQRRRTQQTVTCPHCGRDHATERLRTAAGPYDSVETARAARGRLDADRAGCAEVYARAGDWRDQQEQAARRLTKPWYAAAFATQAEETLGEWRATPATTSSVDDTWRHDLFSTAVDDRLEQTELFSDAADRYLSRRFETATVEAPSPPEPAYEPTLSIGPTPTGQQPLEHIDIGVSPTVSTWLPTVIAELLEPIRAAAAAWVRQQGGEPSQAHTYTHDFAEALASAAGQPAPAPATLAFAGYVLSLVRVPRQLAATDGRQTDRRSYLESLVETAEAELTNWATGRGTTRFTVDDLRRTVVPLFELVDDVGDEASVTGEAPPITADMDATAWVDCEDRQTRQRSLDALAALGRVADVDLRAGPRVEQRLRSLHPEWAACLADSRNPGRGCGGSPDDAPEAADPALAWGILQGMDKREGKCAILSFLAKAEPATRTDMLNAEAVAYAAGTIDEYLTALETHELVTVDRAGRANDYRLSAIGEAAVELLADDLTVVHPQQEELLFDVDAASSDRLAETTELAASTVCRAGKDGRGAEGGGAATATATATATTASAVPAEDRLLAETGCPDDDDVHWWQWYPKVDCGETRSARPLEDRLRAIAHQDVVVNEYPVTEWEDARVVQGSCTGETLVLSVQWSRPRATLVRLASALLDVPVWDHVLTESRYEDLRDELGTRATELLQRRDQVGWLAEDNEEYHDLQDRLSGVSRRLRAELADEEADSEDLKQLFRDAHGLMMTATELLDEMGYDLLVDLRVPDRNRTDFDELAEFLAQTVPRHAEYGSHVVWRNAMEDREDRREFADPIDVDYADVEAETTAQWVVSGPDVGDCVDQLRAKLQLLESERLQADKDDYEPIKLPIRIGRGDSRAAFRHAVEYYLQDKQYLVRGEADRIEETARLFAAWTGSALDAADGMARLRRRCGRQITLGDIRYCLSMLPAGRLLPDHPPSVGKLVKALLEADEPLGRSELIDRAGISSTSYDSYISVISAFELVERVGRKWELSVAPHYASQMLSQLMDTAALDDGGGPVVADVLVDALEALGWDGTTAAIVEAFGPPPYRIDQEVLYATLGERIAPWLEFVTVLLKPQPDAVGRSLPATVSIGGEPAQQSLHLAETTTPDESPAD